MSVRKSNTIATDSHIISNCEEIGRALIDIHDIETDIQDGPAPTAIALEYLVEGFVEQRAELFDVKKRAEDGKTHVIYTGSDDQ